jgi:hypothetical protein
MTQRAGEQVKAAGDVVCPITSREVAVVEVFAGGRGRGIRGGHAVK